MTYSSSLVSNHQPLVIDTSVIINLYASSFGGQILLAIPNGIIVPQVVADELTHETSQKNGGYQFLQTLVTQKHVQLSEMDDEEYEIFGELISVAPTLDDGEAATIAIASRRNLIPIIDEKKGRSRALPFLGSGLPGWSLDLLRHPAVIAKLGNASALDALYYALNRGRMRIPPDSTEQVIAIIGMERSLKCPCLPGYSERFRKVLN
jgi:predicted nucleic acid-binding protein